MKKIIMADKRTPDICGQDDRQKTDVVPRSQAEKRKSTGNAGEPEHKKSTIQMKKISMNLSSSSDKVSSDPKPMQPGPIKMSLGATQKPKEQPALPKSKSVTVAQAFNVDDESDEEEMPAEAKMRMKNVGRDTPTASGPNSFGKGRLGFSDHRKIMEKMLSGEKDPV